MEKIKNNCNNKPIRRSVARLMSCQALYMYYDPNVEDKNIDNILKYINDYYIKEYFKREDGKTEFLDLFKNTFVKELIVGVIENRENIDILINKLLNKTDTVETLEPVLLQCFRLAHFELQNYDTKKEDIIKEYVDIVAEFYSDNTINFANGLISNISAIIRDKVDINSLIDKKDNKVKIKNKKNRKILKLNNEQ